MIKNDAPSHPKAPAPYPVRDFTMLRGLTQLKDPLIEAHLALYEAYVRNVNILGQHLNQGGPGTVEWAEMKRRLGYEVNGLRLHELYFENLTPEESGIPSSLENALGAVWGSFKFWREDFESTGQLRGVGWVILYRDPVNGRMSNHWINLHEDGHPAGFAPLLVMDVWEHAYTGLDRSTYIQAFFMNIDWARVEKRWQDSSGVEPGDRDSRP